MVNFLIEKTNLHNSIRDCRSGILRAIYSVGSGEGITGASATGEFFGREYREVESDQIVSQKRFHGCMRLESLKFYNHLYLFLPGGFSSASFRKNRAFLRFIYPYILRVGRRNKQIPQVTNRGFAFQV